MWYYILPISSSTNSSTPHNTNKSEVCPSSSTNTILASVFTAIITALLTTVISVIMQIAVCKLVPSKVHIWRSWDSRRGGAGVWGDGWGVIDVLLWGVVREWMILPIWSWSWRSKHLSTEGEWSLCTHK